MVALLFGFNTATVLAQHCGGAATLLAKWDFNSLNIECNGAENIGPTPIINPSITPGAQYCPNQNNGCGATVLGSVGHQNTPQFQNAICLANFYNVEAILASGTGAPYDPDATIFDPEGKANLSVWYDIPKNTEGCLTSFQLKVLQKQFNGTTLNFETQGVAVKRNGVLIYETSVPITTTNVNGTPFNFTFTGDEFCSDGSEIVEFEIIFGLVHRLIGPALPGTPGQTGYDDVCVNGFCKTQSFGGIVPAVCGASGIETDAQVLIQNFESGNTYDFIEGDSYTGTATFGSGSLPIPMSGLIPDFANPASSTNYTFRVFQEENCFSDFTVTLDPQYCCVVPEGTVVVTPATCNGGMANDDAQITITGVTGGGTKAGISTGNTYSGPSFAAAEDLVGGEFTFADLPNPLVSQPYTVRLFLDAVCFIDYPAAIFNENCTVPCIPPNGVVLSSTPPNCSGVTRLPDATISVTNVNGGDRVGFSPSITYSGPDYDNAFDLVNGSYTFTDISTPDGTEIYTVRVYNTSDGCYIDQTVEIEDPQCGDAVNIGAFVRRAGPNTLEADGSNNQDAFMSAQNDGFIDLALTKTVDPGSGNTCVVNGTPFVWTLTVTNNGNMMATGVNVVDLLPEGLSMTASSADIGEFFGGSGWDIGDLGAGVTATLEITTIALSAGSYLNCAYINAAFPENDPNSSTDNDESANEDDDDCASITVTGNNTPIVEKSFSPMLPRPNTPFRLTIKITNNNDAPITLTSDLVDAFPSSPAQMTIAATPNLYVSSSITPAGMGIVATANGTSLTIPTGTVLLPGLNQISVDVVVPQLGDYCNSIDMGDLVTDIGSNCLGSEACIKANPDFVMAPIVTTMIDPEIVGPGETTTLTITIENVNDDPMTLNQDFTNMIPDGLTVNGPITSTGNDATLENGDMEVNLPSGTVIPPNSTYTITVPLIAPNDDVGPFTNTIIMNQVLTTVGSNNENGNEEVAEAVLRIMSGFDLALRKTLAPASPATFAPGDPVAFDVTVFNQGMVTAFDIDVADYADAAELDFVSVGTTTMTLNGNAVTVNPAVGLPNFEIEELAAGDSVTVTINFTVDAVFAGASIINNAEIVDASDSDGGATALDEDSPLTDVNDGTANELATNDDIDDDAPNTPGTMDNPGDEDDYDAEEIMIVECLITPMASSVCVDGGTSSDPSDDTHTVTVSATVMNGGATNQYEVLIGADTYGPFTYGGDNTFSVDADGSSPTLTFQDVDDNTCTNTVDIGPLDPCSDDCVLTPMASSVCVDGGTSSDPSDDTHTVTVSATAMNGGATNQYEVLIGADTYGPFTYGGDNTFSVDADGSSPTLTFQDVDDNTCMNTVSIGPLDPCSNDCDLSIMSVDADCQAGETGKYDLTIEVNYLNGPGGVINASLGTGEMATSATTSAGNGSTTITFTGLTNTGGTNIQIDLAFDLEMGCSDQSSFDAPTDCCPAPDPICELDGDSYTLTAEAGFSNYQWYLDGAPISGANSMSIIATSAGVYTWTAIDGSDCPVISCCPITLEDNCDPQVFDLALRKTVSSSGPYVLGGSVTFLIEVFNQGDVDAVNVQISDYIPAGLILDDIDWSETAGVATLDMPIASILAGQVEQLEITFMIDPGFAGGSIINTAEISDYDDDGNPSTPRPEDEDSIPGDNEGDDETGTDNNVDDDGPGGNGTPDNPSDADDFDPAEIMIQDMCEVEIIISDITSCVEGEFLFLAVLDWVNAPTMGDLQYSVDDGPYLDIPRTNFASDATNQEVYVDGLVCNDSRKVSFRFEDAPDCFVEAVFVFPPTDPAGYIYCEETGEVIQGGSVTVNPPAGGSFAFMDSQDGADGRYAWIATGSPVTFGEYTMTYTPPAGFSLSGTPGDRAGDTDDVMDPTPGSEDNPPPSATDTLFLGSDLDGSGQFLADFQPASNPFFLRFSLEQNDPWVDNNNLPLVGCICPEVVTVAPDATICATQIIDLTIGASISPADLGGSWSTPNGTGDFDDGTDFASATTYTPSPEDIQRGSVTLILSSNDPDGDCPVVSEEVTFTILKVDCGDFLWDGDD
ncbi:MAG: hypothetical protein AAF433_20765 [Bacteroidota bacterium]